MNELQEQIDLRSKEIYTDSYGMSLGEIISMYKEGDIDIHPDFQRFFRWTSFQKSRLIESLLLGIPVPPIFVAQRKDGIWDIVDGLQRISTVLQFVGILKDENGKPEEPLILEATKLLPALEGKFFGDDNSEENENSFTESQRRYFKRLKFNFIIIQQISDLSNKYELFQRLNTGGTALNSQEVRSCLMVMTNSELFKRIKALTEYPSFIQTTRLNDKNLEEQYDLELIIRFICLRNVSIEKIKLINDLGNFLDDCITEKMKDSGIDWEKEFEIFRKTFDKLQSSSNERSFIRYSSDKQNFSGGFLVSAYEMIALSIGYNPDAVETDTIEEKIKQTWTQITNDKISWKGLSSSGRLNKTLELGRKTFQDLA